MIIDPASYPSRDLYSLITGFVVPRPIALVTTVGPKGVNAAPFSFFNAVATDPPTILSSIGDRSDGEVKDTLRNIRHTLEFVVHVVDEKILPAANLCALEFPVDVNELAEAGLASVGAALVTPPRIVDAPVQMECRVVTIHSLGDRERHHVIFGEVLLIHLRDGVIDAGRNVDLGELKPVGRLGNVQYCKISDPFRIARPLLKSPVSKEKVTSTERRE